MNFILCTSEICPKRNNCLRQQPFNGRHIHLDFYLGGYSIGNGCTKYLSVRDEKGNYIDRHVY